MNQEKIVELQKQNNMYAKCLLLLEWVIGIISSFSFLILIFVVIMFAVILYSYLVSA